MNAKDFISLQKRKKNVQPSSQPLFTTAQPASPCPLSLSSHQSRHRHRHNIPVLDQNQVAARPGEVTRQARKAVSLKEGSRHATTNLGGGNYSIQMA